MSRDSGRHRGFRSVFRWSAASETITARSPLPLGLNRYSDQRVGMWKTCLKPVVSPPLPVNHPVTLAGYPIAKLLMKGKLLVSPPREVMDMSAALRLDVLAFVASFALLAAIVFGLV
jgi:hypothetical protein